MFTTGMPKIYRMLEYAILLVAVVVIWQAIATQPTIAQNDDDPDTWRNLLQLQREYAEQADYDTFAITVETPILDRTRLTIGPREFHIASIGEDYICLQDEGTFSDTPITYCLPLSNVIRIDQFAG